MRYGERCRRVHRTAWHPDYPWLLGHIDREVVGRRTILELKNVSFFAGAVWGPDGSNELPEHVIAQARHYMMIWHPRYERAEVVAYFGGADLRRYPLERDREYEDLALDAANDFWHNHVLADVPPEIDYSHPSTPALLKRLYPGTNGETVELSQEVADWHGMLDTTRRHIKAYEEIERDLRARIMAAMGEAAIGKLPDGQGCYKRTQVTVPESVRQAYSFIRMGHSSKLPKD